MDLTTKNVSTIANTLLAFSGEAHSVFPSANSEFSPLVLECPSKMPLNRYRSGLQTA